MKKNICILCVILTLVLTSNAQNNSKIQSLAGPRLGFVGITDSRSSLILNGDLKVFDRIPSQSYYEENVNGAWTSLYGWQFESRFADGGDVTGIVEWILLAGGMEKGLFLPSVSSLVGVRNKEGFEFALGPNLSLTGIAMVLGVGYNFNSGNLNIPINIAFVPGRQVTRVTETDKDINIKTGNRISITAGFNLSR
tara:strand:+ start:700 stop:1284 length:585 start_codon:yes stop_codon:yes gene_type:complete